MKRIVLAFIILFSAGRVAWSADPPITADKGEIGKLLLKWQAEGTAAGNGGDWYDNRDDGHSQLDVRPYPQLQSIIYTAEEKKRGEHWALRSNVLPKVVFGNSSTSAPPKATGSNPRSLYYMQNGLELLSNQYRGNNLYMYPEHRDHDVFTDTDGDAGYGDLYPTNTPFLMISQGSSGTDQPFMKAVPFTMAALRPEVKKKLIDEGLLMPVIQLLMRKSYKAVVKPEDYLTGKAHPTVFEGNKIDAKKMVELAHEMTVKTIPPFVKLKLEVLEKVQPSKEFYDPVQTELLGVSESVIAVIHRSFKYERHMIVDVSESFDVNKKPLTFHWKVLRGDEKLVQIKPLNDKKSKAEITIKWHGREPLNPGSELETNRIDIGVFANNGSEYSPPAFITSTSIPQESRTYDKSGRLLEVGYGFSSSRFKVSDWDKFHEALLAEKKTYAVQEFFKLLSPAQVTQVKKLSPEIKLANQNLNTANEKKKSADEAVKKAVAKDAETLKKSAGEAQRAVNKATEDLNKLLDQELEGNAGPWRKFISLKLSEIIKQHGFYASRIDEFKDQAKFVDGQLKQLETLGVIKIKDQRSFTLLPVTLKPAESAYQLNPDNISNWQQAQLEKFHGDLLVKYFPGISHTHQPHVLDFRLSLPKAWRDVYHYTDKNQIKGWTRYSTSGVHEFTAAGMVVLTRDDKGRCKTAAEVQYTLNNGNAQISPWQTSPLTYKILEKSIDYKYENDNDQIGQPVK